MEITDIARDELKSLIESEKTSGIRLQFKGFGCGGPNFRVSLDEPQPDDQVNVINDIRVAIDPYLANWVVGLVLDYKKERGTFSFLGGSSC